jgi:hypothetical protein
MEAVLIEGLEPRQNRKRGDDFQARLSFFRSKIQSWKGIGIGDFPRTGGGV